MKLIFGSTLLLLASLVIVAVLIVTLRPALAASTADGTDGTIVLGRRWTETFYRRDLAAFWSRLDDRARTLFGNVDGLAAFRTKVQAQLGAERAVVSERVERQEGMRVYVRVAQFEQVPMPFQVKIGFDAQDHIVAFGVLPTAAPTPAPSTRLDYRTKTPLRLPFDGTWAVAWGGRTVEENQHAPSREQRFAYDLLIAHGEATHSGDGTHNSDYFCHGKPVLAPGAGKVVVAHDGVAENVPGQMNAREVLGNHVIIDHGNGEFSFLAHFETGSVAVHAGDQVLAGQLLGRCGNSGNSSEPHLHYHLQTTPRFGDGEGLPAQLRDYLADGKRVPVGEPTRGQLIAPAPTTAHQ